MILTFDDRVVKDLAFLEAVSVEHLQEFCAIALQFIVSEGNPSLFSRAATALGLEKEVVANGSAALVKVLIECSKNGLGKEKCLLSIADFSCSDDHKMALAEFYSEHRKEIKSSLAGDAMSFPSYHNLEWRLDVEVASRGLHTKMEPSFVVRLDTKAPDVTSTFMQADYANMKRLVEALEAAEAEMKNSHSTRVIKWIR